MNHLIKQLLLLTLVVTVISCKKEEAKEEFIRPVKAMQVATSSDFLNKGFPAVSQETRLAEMAFRVSGNLTTLNVEEGQKLSRNQLIAELDGRDYRTDVAAKRARYEQTQAEKDRYEGLYERGSVSKNDYDLKLANFLEAKSAYEASQNALRDTRLVAPFEGFVDKKMVENFQEVTAGQTIITLIDMSAIEVKLFIPEQLAVQFFNFQGYEVVFETYPDQTMTAQLKEIGKSPEPEGFPLTLYLDHTNTPGGAVIITPGMSCQVNIKLGGETAEDVDEPVVVPLTAVFEDQADNQPSVWIFDQESGVVTKRNVSVGDFTSNTSIQIIDGLNSGEWVVTAGAHRLTEGQKVKLLAERL